MKKGYKIDFSANTVIINKNFEQAAQCLNTPEFKLCRVFREMGLTIARREKTEMKNRKPRPTYQQMEHYIEMLEGGETYKREYKAVRKEAETKKNPYSRVCAWFNRTFPDFTKPPVFNEEYKIVVKRREEKKAELALVKEKEEQFSKVSDEN